MTTETATQDAGRPGTTGVRVMVVDDDTDIANLVATVLRDEGYTARVVTDSRQAVEVFGIFQPDLVTLDVMMPSVDVDQPLPPAPP